MFSSTEMMIGTETVNLTLAEIQKENEYVYFNYRKILSKVQWTLLSAIAKEGILHNPNSKDFVQRSGLGAASSVSRALKSLMEKDMVEHHLGENISYYQLDDVFLEKWLQRL